MMHEAWGHGDWGRVTIRYCGDEYAITADGFREQHWHMRNVRFRPIKTAEQIAAEERLQAIDEMQRDSGWQGKGGGCPFASLYDKGYRKPEGANHE
jgi:hypothetical protein